MKLAPNTFKHAIEKGEKQIGIWISLCSNFAAEVTAHSGYDWALIDMEHSSNDYLSVFGQLQAFASSDTTAIVRVEWNNSVAIKRIMDLGPQGILFPMIQSVEEAKQAVAATRYPPKGVRGVAGATRATKFGRIKDYYENVDKETAVLLQLESLEAMSHAEEIADIEGVSGIFFGPADIAADMGKLAQNTDPEVWANIKATAKNLMAKGMPVGTLVFDPNFAIELLNEGFSFVAVGIDASILAKASDNLLAEVKAGMK